VLPLSPVATIFVWDSRPGRNLEHIAEHDMTPALWQEVFDKATRHAPDKDDTTVILAEGRIRGQLYRIFYSVLEDGQILPLTILPITGFPIKRRGLR
jgi:hypothetical protein